MSQPRNGLGVLSHDQATFIITLKVLSTFKWAEILACYVREFPGGNRPTENDFRTRFGRQLREHQVRVSLQYRQPLEAADQTRAARFLQRYVPTDRLSDEGRAFNGLPAGAGVGTSSAHDSGSQPTSSAPAPGPFVPAIQQDPNGQAPTTSSDNDDSVFGWVFPAVDQGPMEQQAPQTQELAAQETHVGLRQSESTQTDTIYPDPEECAQRPYLPLEEWYADMGLTYFPD